MRLHFTKLELTWGSVLKIMDTNGKTLATYSNFQGGLNLKEDLWTDWFTADTLKVRLETDKYGGGYGFLIDQKETRKSMAPSTVTTTPVITPTIPVSTIPISTAPTTTPPLTTPVPITQAITQNQPSMSASVNLYGEKTDVVRGENILLKLSAVNIITKPKMHVQVIIIPPSGMSVTSSEFSKSAAGQFTANYQLEPSDGKDIEVRIISNQIGDFNVNGRIIYYFGDDKVNAEDQTLNLPIKVRKEPGQTAPAVSADVPAKAPGFGGELAIIGLLLMAIYIRKRF